MSSTSLLEEELNEFCRSDSVSEDGLREIIERHGVAPSSNDPNIDYKFFHKACRNERLTEGILRYLLEHFPNAVRYVGSDWYLGELPLHTICINKNVTPGVVQLLVDAFPDSLRHEDNHDLMPLQYLCSNKNLNEEVGLEILMLLLERSPESVRHATRNGRLPLHFAAASQSSEFCRILIEAYPGSERMINIHGDLPFHSACAYNTVATVKYLYQLYPESINVEDHLGRYPIHCAITRDKTETVIDVIHFLLLCNRDVVLQELDGKLPLYWVCIEANYVGYNDVKLITHLRVLQILYDAYPEAIEDNEVASNIHRFHPRKQLFINSQLTYARQARDSSLMTTRDENGQLPLHQALCGEVRLGSIKLLVKGNSSAVRTPDGDGALPLHLACLHYDDARVVEYLINLDPTTLRAFDGEGNTALHYACRGAKHDTIALLLGKYGGVSVSNRNAHNQLPIELLYESEAVSDRDSIEYTESIFRLIRAYPDTVL